MFYSLPDNELKSQSNLLSYLQLMLHRIGRRCSCASARKVGLHPRRLGNLAQHQQLALTQSL